MDGDRDDRQVEVVEHDWDVMVQASTRVEMEVEDASADQGHGCYLCKPENETTEYSKQGI